MLLIDDCQPGQPGLVVLVREERRKPGGTLRRKEDPCLLLAVPCPGIVDDLDDRFQTEELSGRARDRVFESVAESLGELPLLGAPNWPGAGDHPEMGIADAPQCLSEQFHPGLPRETAVKDHEDPGLVFQRLACGVPVDQQAGEFSGSQRRSAEVGRL